MEDFPIFDAHLHFSQGHLDEILASYEECGVRAGVNLWGAAGGKFNFMYHGDYEEFLKICRKRGLEKRFVNYYWPNYEGFGAAPEKFVANLCGDLRRFAKLGCRGLKVWKDLGMYIRFADGTPATMDDERLEPVWKTCAELRFGVSIHQTDPSQGWEKNCTTGLSRERLWKCRDAVILAHPEIRFILCHSANYIESVEKFGALLDKLPNANADLCPLERHNTLEEIRQFLEKYSTRLYVGGDLLMPENRTIDRKWNIEFLYGPWHTRLRSYNMSPETFKNVTWANGERDFLRA